MNKMTERTRAVDGVKTSFLDLGFDNCGLDDNWQQCGAGYLKSFHDSQGKPLINTERFPSMKAMTDYGHKLGLRVGWYMNNCICSEHMFKTDADIANHMEQSAAAVAEYGFDGVKLDGCGQFRNLTWWAQLLNKTGRPILIENCHWGGTIPGQTTGDGPCVGGGSKDKPSDCPYNFFRSSGDIRNNWNSMTGNLASTMKFQGDPPLVGPGTWAYPDMMEVGRMANVQEDRTHFGAWVITSSPLIMGYDMNDESITDRIWPFISNTEAIAINQAWAGHPGRLVKSWTPSPSGPTPSPSDPSEYVMAASCDEGSATQKSWSYESATKAVKGPGGKCLDGTTGQRLVELMLTKCNASSPSQMFDYDAASKRLTLHSNGMCVDVHDWSGPQVQLFGCNGGSNQQFDFNSDGSLTDASTDSSRRHCLDHSSVPPGPVPAGDIHLWAKPLPGGDTAVLVMNYNSDSNYTVDVEFDILGAKVSNSADAKMSVRDVWNKKDMGVFSGKFTTAELLPHDSGLFVLKPSTA